MGDFGGEIGADAGGGGDGASPLRSHGATKACGDGYLGADGEEGVIRIGTEGVHTKTYLAGEVVSDIKFVPVYQ